MNVPVYYPGGTAAAYAGSRSFSIVQHLRATAANASPPSVSRIKFGDDHDEDSDEVTLTSTAQSSGRPVEIIDGRPGVVKLSP